MGKKLRKSSSVKTGIEEFGYDEVDRHYNETYDKNQGTKDFIPLTMDDDSEVSDDEEDMKAMGLENHGNCIHFGNENESDAEHDEEDNQDYGLSKPSARNDWGRKIENYYEENLDFDHLEESDADSDLALQEEEALEFQSAHLATLNEADFETEDLLLSAGNAGDEKVSTTLASTFEKELDAIMSGLVTFVDVENLEKSGIASVSLKEMSAEERQLIIDKDHPELIPLLKDMKERSEELTKRVTPILERVELRQMLTSEGLSFLEMKHHLLLCYLQYLCYYILLKLNGHFVSNHPVIERLIELKLLFQKIRPIEMKLQVQISDLLLANQNDKKASREIHPSVLSRKCLKPHPELLMPAGRETDLLESATNDDRVVDSSDDNNDDNNDDDKNEVYKAPKLVAMEYIDKTKDSFRKKLEKQLEKDEQKMKKSEAVEALREEFSEAPLELGGTNLAQLASQSNKSRQFLLRQAEKEAFEEEYMMRLPTTKADKKGQKLLKEKQKAILAGGSTLEDLTSFADAAIDSTFDDPSLKGLALGSKKASKLAASLSAVHQASQRILGNKKKEKQTADVHVTARQVNRQKKHAVDADTHFGGGYEAPNARDNVDEEMPDVIRDALEKKQIKKEARKEKLIEERLKTLPKLDETTNQKRKTTYQIEKNKGLVRKRKAIEGSSRAHNRQKYAKKLKRFKGMHQEVREGTVDGGYSGEATGINTRVKKSVNLAS